jgi:hypothetical protein
VLASGNVLVCGQLDTVMSGAQDIALLLFSPSGELLSQQRINMLEGEYVNELGVLADGSSRLAFLTRDISDEFSGVLTIDADGMPVSAESATFDAMGPAGDMWVLDIHTPGPVPQLEMRNVAGDQQWIRLIDVDSAATNDDLWAIFVDSAGSSYLLGRHYEPDQYPVCLRFDATGALTGSFEYNETAETYALGIDSHGCTVTSIYGQPAATGDWEPLVPDIVTDEATGPLGSFGIDFAASDLGLNVAEGPGIADTPVGVLDTGGGAEDIVVIKRDVNDW